MKAGPIPPEAHAIAGRLRALNPEQIYLFGSYGRSEGGPDSDVDFLVVAPRSTKSRYQRAVEALGLVRDIHFPKDITVMTGGEWERDLDAACSLASTVRREGRPLAFSD